MKFVKAKDAVGAEVQVLINEKSSDNDVILFLDGSVVWPVLSSGVFNAQVSG
jgi:hypothetical protein